MPMDRAALARHLLDESQLRQQLEREYLPCGIPAFDEALGKILKRIIEWTLTTIRQ